MKPLFKKEIRCYVCGRRPTALYHLKPVCERCYQKLKHPTKRKCIGMESLIKLQEQVTKEYNLKYQKLLRKEYQKEYYQRPGKKTKSKEYQKEYYQLLKEQN